MKTFGSVLRVVRCIPKDVADRQSFYTHVKNELFISIGLLAADHYDIMESTEIENEGVDEHSVQLLVHTLPEWEEKVKNVLNILEKTDLSLATIVQVNNALGK